MARASGNVSKKMLRETELPVGDLRGAHSVDSDAFHRQRSTGGLR
jgi:hypothetical protein